MSEPSSWTRPWGPMHPTVATLANMLFEVELPPDALPMPAGLLVGEQPGPKHNPRLPLWPYPPRSAGGRLFAMSGMPLTDYLTRLARVNLAANALDKLEKWDKDRARERAQMIHETLPVGTRVVLCGARARDAFDMPSAWFIPVTDSKVSYVAVPHPSGRCREYLDPANVTRARTFIHWAADWRAA